ncbi:MAG: GNAT family N-acetyltransferase [Bacteroidales bacterium]|nr:GNAT family N-acetyltransferase [Bacteroidales bacterium]
MDKFNITVATEKHLEFVPHIEEAIIVASKVKGTGIAKRSKEYIADKIVKGKAVIAVHEDGSFAGFCYVETWGHEKFVANSGLIVVEKYRGRKLAYQIKSEAFRLSRKLYPSAKIFGLTTSLAVMKINSSIGYQPVTFSLLTDDDEFWKGCQTCSYYDILFRTNRSLCLCTGLLYDPSVGGNKKNGIAARKRNGKKAIKQKKGLIKELLSTKK